jgi:hypothetical protein
VSNPKAPTTYPLADQAASNTGGQATSATLTTNVLPVPPAGMPTKRGHGTTKRHHATGPLGPPHGYQAVMRRACRRKEPGDSFQVEI